MVSPGVIDTGWPNKLRDGKAKRGRGRPLQGCYQARGGCLALNQPEDVAINEIIVTQVDQAWRSADSVARGYLLTGPLHAPCRVYERE